MGLARRLLGVVPDYAALAWWGLVAPRVAEPEPLRVVQGVVLAERRVLLSVRGDLHGWELPGGAPEPGETDEAALVREIREETGLAVRVERHVADYVRTGFRPHTARIFRCRVDGGSLRPSAETPRLGWFEADALPATLFPWYRGPLADALADRPDPVVRCEHQGVAAILAGLRIDLRMRLCGDAAGRPQP